MVGETWRAQARLGYSVHSSIVWSDEHPEGTVITVVGRVMEKTALWTAYVVEQTIKRCMELGLVKAGQTVCHWSDTGPHYRANLFLACANKRWPQMFRTSNKVKFGLEHHMKEEADRYFALCDARLKFAETQDITSYGISLEYLEL